MNIPRIVIGAAASNSGKTIFTSALLYHLKQEGIRQIGYKCGPDYIDPMFHRTVTGVECRNLDPFFLDRDGMLRVLAKSAGYEIAVLEGVMGYYDGGDDSELSTYAVAKQTETNAILVIDAKGSAVSCLAVAYGMKDFYEDSRICGVVFNRMSKAVYEQVQAANEKRNGSLRLLGYIPVLPEECRLESRHLGLVTPAEIENLRMKIALAYDKMKASVDWEGILAIAAESEEIEQKEIALLQAELSESSERLTDVAEMAAEMTAAEPKPVIAVARDEAFCFYYEDNLDLLSEQGFEIKQFSPLADEPVPEDACGLYIGGGYPELYLEKLEHNETTKASIQAAFEKKMPCIAECGGFMYLSKEIEGHRMCGVLDGSVTKQGRLVRFGYVTLTAKEDSLLFEAGDQIHGHEFHYYDSTENGAGLLAKKRNGTQYECVVTGENLYAGFPHLYLESNRKAAERFAAACRKFQKDRE